MKVPVSKQNCVSLFWTSSALVFTSEITGEARWLNRWNNGKTTGVIYIYLTSETLKSYAVNYLVLNPLSEY